MSKPADWVDDYIAARGEGLTQKMAAVKAGISFHAVRAHMAKYPEAKTAERDAVLAWEEHTQGDVLETCLATFESLEGLEQLKGGQIIFDLLRQRAYWPRRFMEQEIAQQGVDSGLSEARELLMQANAGADL